MIIVRAVRRILTNPEPTIYSESVSDHKSRRTSPSRTSARGKKLFDRIFNGLRIPLQIARHGVADSLLGIEHQGRGQHLHLPRRRRDRKSTRLNSSHSSSSYAVFCLKK